MNKTKRPKKISDNRGNKKSINKAGRKKSKNDSLVPLLIILIILLSLTSFLAFSDKSSILSDLFSKNIDEAPIIERPEIIHQEITRESDPEESSYSVTREVVVRANPEESSDQKVKAQGEKSLKARLFFVKVSDEGQISLKSIIRNVYYTAAPLTETVNSLIAGPDRSDLNKGLLNLIPKDSRLLSIKISNKTAYINFNESFRYNSLGIEGYKAQLMQIIYTATEFQSVDNVQILINNQIFEYLGPEGVFIGEPINRDYFNTF